tara:strand:+ start:605 stop:1354 length:750 start_codon:yes stop_codon:yes gene_type:complete
MTEFVKPILKKTIIPILLFIRRVIEIIQTYAIPKKTFKTSLPFEMYQEESVKRSYDYFKEYFPKCVFLEKSEIQKFALNKSLESDSEQNFLYLEFGVFNGDSLNLFADNLRTKIYGFDSFEGLKEDWLGTSLQKGFFNLYGKIPKLRNNAIPIKGWVQDTLLEFLKSNTNKINFIHMDLDTYDSCKYVLEKIKPQLTDNCIILFDELYNYGGWENGEVKALEETFAKNEYKFLAFGANSQQAVIQLVKK